MSHKQTVYRLQGLSCTNCAAKFEQNIRNIESVQDVQLNFGAAKVTVIGEVTREEIEAAGAFDQIKVFPEDEPPIREKKQSFFQIKYNILILIAVAFIILGYALSFTMGSKHLITILSFIIAIMIGGYDLFKVGLKNLSRLEFDMKTLMTIAVIGATIIGEWAEAAVVVFLFAISEALEGYSIDKARQSIHSLMELAPERAQVRRNGHVRELPVEDILIGDIMLIKPGEKIAMDGEVIKGESSINQAAITGESIPVHKTVGDEVFAGTINEEGFLEVRVTKLVGDTTIAKIIHLVEEAQAEKAPSQQFVDKFAKYYTPAIMVIALLVAVIPPLFFVGSWSEWIYLGLAVLVVGCPCALVISTPVAIVTAIGHAARRGVLIKGGIHLEEAGKLQAIAFDKTGTLTEGKPQVTDVLSVSNLTKERILGIARAIEVYSQHPLASAIIHEADKVGVPSLEANDFQSITGKGAVAVIEDEKYYIGNLRLFSEQMEITKQITAKIKQFEEAGKTVILLGTKKEILGIFAAADQVRKNSGTIMKKLAKYGIRRTVLLTGDNQATGHAIGQQLHIDEIRAELLPEDKLTAIKSLQQTYGYVGMVGDGINDAPALATASVGIAMGGVGTDTALETADIALMADDLEQLPNTIALSRKTLRVIKQNISFSLLVKLIALLLVIPGWLTLWLAIFADVGATLIVVLNSMRLMKVRDFAM